MGTQCPSEVICWGLATSFRLGDAYFVGDPMDRRTRPVSVRTLPWVSAVEAGGGHSCAIDRDGEVWCWGQNGRGQLGDGAAVFTRLPVRVSGLPGAALAFALLSAGAVASTNALHNLTGCAPLRPRHWIAPAVLFVLAPFVFGRIHFLQHRMAWRGRVYELDRHSRLASER